MTRKKKPAKRSPKSRKNMPHDALLKKVMENEVVAQEFLEEYLPSEFKAMIDLSTIKVEKESFVEKHLVRQLSDIVLSIKTKANEQAFVYTLIEAQTSSDYWIALRLWKYTLLLCERHMKDKDKLPLIYPIVLYHGNKKYDAPRSLWELFADPIIAKRLLTEENHLIDLQAMQDDEINYDKHLSMLLYMLKHAHQRDKLKLTADILKKCKKAIFFDQERGYIYIKFMVWYNNNQIPVEQKPQLEQLILDNLPKEDIGEIMKTIADDYIEQGFEKGMIQGIEKGREEGIEKGIMQTAVNMLQHGADPKFIATVTGLSTEEILKLKHKGL